MKPDELAQLLTINHQLSSALRVEKKNVPVWTWRGLASTPPGLASLIDSSRPSPLFIPQTLADLINKTISLSLSP